MAWLEFYYLLSQNWTVYGLSISKVAGIQKMILRFEKWLTHVYQTSDSIDYDQIFDVYYNMYIHVISIY